MADGKGFTFWENYYITISDPDNGLSDDERGQLYKAIVEFIFDGRKPTFKGTLRAIFSALLPSLEKSKTRSISGSRRGSKTQTKDEETESKPTAKPKQNGSKTQTKDEETEAKSDFASPYKKKKKESIILTDNTKREDIKGDSQRGIDSESEELNAKGRFFKEFPSVVFDNYDASVLAELTEDDWDTIAEQFRKSEWLKKNVKTMSMLCRLSARIVAGAYAPFEKVQTEQDEDLSEDERRENAKWFDETFGKAGE